ncbi:hypothetical protein CDAR_14991 [Caerostris darwini]|uniref:Uncharacterized protein n=1 Tax=Caerostris darwini TaxID=1538125 RepID=A0AAV4PAL1_9ARAC|nr:hypothetical protein CDAR_14991 [Caerostris darwini]
MGKFNQLLKGIHTSCDALRSISYASINELCPEPKLLRIYSDGSRVEQRLNAGAGVFWNLFSVYALVGRFASAYDGKYEALATSFARCPNSFAMPNSIIFYSSHPI